MSYFKCYVESRRIMHFNFTFRDCFEIFETDYSPCNWLKSAPILSGVVDRFINKLFHVIWYYLQSKGILKLRKKNIWITYWIYFHCNNITIIPGFRISTNRILHLNQSDQTVEDGSSPARHGEYMPCSGFEPDVHRQTMYLSS